jgi:predicted secreted protein
MALMMNRTQAMRPVALAILAALLAACSTACLTACSTAERAAPVVAPPSVVQSPGRKAVNVTEAQSGAAVVLESGQQLIVTLPLSATSGLQWSPVDLKPGVITAIGSTFERASRDVSNDEATGAEVWRFAPEAAGMVALRLELRRPRSLAPAAQTVSYSVTVK